MPSLEESMPSLASAHGSDRVVELMFREMNSADAQVTDVGPNERVHAILLAYGHSCGLDMSLHDPFKVRPSLPH